MIILEKFNKEINAVNKEIQRILTGDPDRLYQASRHLLISGGKRIRPIICILSCKAVGGNKNDAIKSGAAIELIHNFTLIHDDIMDKDELRRGVPSVHKKFGEYTAILAGDLLFAKAFDICNPEIKEILAKASSKICEGQEFDMSFKERNNVRGEEYLEMIKRKTAVLFEAAANSGAVIGQGNSKEIKALASYGLNLGMAFQIQDDILGIIAKEEKLGKPVGSDIVEGKKSLITITALEKLEGSKKQELIRILNKIENTKSEIDKVVEIFIKSNAINYCKEKANSYVENAKSSLKEIKSSEAKEDLIKIADFVVERDV